MEDGVWCSEARLCRSGSKRGREHENKAAAAKYSSSTGPSAVGRTVQQLHNHACCDCMWSVPCIGVDGSCCDCMWSVPCVGVECELM